MGATDSFLKVLNAAPTLTVGAIVLIAMFISFLFFPSFFNTMILLGVIIFLGFLSFKLFQKKQTQTFGFLTLFALIFLVLGLVMGTFSLSVISTVPGDHEVSNLQNNIGGTGIRLWTGMSIFNQDNDLDRIIDESTGDTQVKIVGVSDFWVVEGGNFQQFEQVNNVFSADCRDIRNLVGTTNTTQDKFCIEKVITVNNTEIHRSELAGRVDIIDITIPIEQLQTGTHNVSLDYLVTIARVGTNGMLTVVANDTPLQDRIGFVTTNFAVIKESEVPEPPVVCVIGEVLENGVCVPVTCDPGFILVGSECILVEPEPMDCPECEERIQGICLPIPGCGVEPPVEPPSNGGVSPSANLLPIVAVIVVIIIFFLLLSRRGK